MVAAVRVVAEEMAEAEKGEAAARAVAARAGVAATVAAVRVVAVPGVGNTHPCLQTQQRRNSELPHHQDPYLWYRPR